MKKSDNHGIKITKQNFKKLNIRFTDPYLSCLGDNNCGYNYKTGKCVELSQYCSQEYFTRFSEMDVQKDGVKFTNVFCDDQSMFEKQKLNWNNDKNTVSVDNQKK